MNFHELLGKKLSGNLDTDLNFLKEIFENDDILRVRRINMTKGQECALLFLDGMVNNNVLNESVVRPILTFDSDIEGENVSRYVTLHILFAAEVSEQTLIDEMLRSMLYGDTLIIFNGDTTALTVNTKGWRTRGISEPSDERVLEGPREGFDEAAMLNMAMLRRKLPTPDLKAEYVRVGRRTDTRTFICYLSSLVNKRALDTLKKELKKIDIDGVLDVNYINELINSNRFSFFKTAGKTERPDIVAAKLLEGRVALIVDGTPVVLTVPYLFGENFQSDDDYYQNYIVAFIGRLMRYICFFLSITLPGIYLALITHHKQLLPTSFFITAADSRRGVPFQSILEALLLILIFEILRETGLRVPQSMGHALSIVGGLVIGQASVEAKIVSAPMLIIVAASGIAGLMVQKLKGAIFYGRIITVVLGNFFGLFGCFAGVTAMLSVVFSLKSYGSDYTAALNNISFQSLKDTVIRAPFYKMLTRPHSLSKNKYRQKRKKKL
ncbi:MAG: spore germination protein [Clostridia bacterium]|nr:spore germination protein [Clostridia bacterium]